MKKMILTMLVTIFSISSIFSATYEELLAKGKQYEANKEYVYALGYYYDATQAKNAQNEANQKFDDLAKKLRQGTAGLNLSLWDDPKAKSDRIINEYLKYFTEYPPYEIVYDEKLKRGELNYQNKTATYLMEYTIQISEKFKQIGEIITKGHFFDGLYTNFYSSSRYYWAEDLANACPYITFQFDNIDKYEEKYKQIENLQRKDRQGKNWTEWGDKYEAQFTELNEQYSKEMQNKILRYYNETGIAFSGLGEIDMYENKLVPSIFFNIMEEQFKYKIENRYTSYDMQFGIYDNSGNLLIKGTRQILEYGSEKEYFISNISEQIMNIIDSGKYTVKPVSMYLNYGIFKKSIDYNEKGSDYEKMRSYIKDTAKIEIKLENVDFKTYTTKQDIYNANINKFETKLQEYVKNFEAFGFTISERGKIISVNKKNIAYTAGIRGGWVIRTNRIGFEVSPYQPDYFDIQNLVNRFSRYHNKI